MSKTNSRDSDSDDFTSSETVDNSYITEGKEPVPVVKDEVAAEQLDDELNPDSDQALARDENDAIDKNNILKGGRTRGAEPQNSYREPGDDEGLPGPGDDGSSSVHQ